MPYDDCPRCWAIRCHSGFMTKQAPKDASSRPKRGTVARFYDVLHGLIIIFELYGGFCAFRGLDVMTCHVYCKSSPLRVLGY